MKLVEYPSRDQWSTLLQRPSHDQTKIEKIVRPILDKVQRGGDKALMKFALEYDHVTLDELLVSPEELVQSHDVVPEELKEAIKAAKANIEKFHEAQSTPELVMETMPGVLCKRRSVPIQRVGLYVPGGSAPLFSTVLMLGIPARIAGCEEIVMSSPTDAKGQVNPAVLYTADLLGIKKILKLGGAQAIAAMAYGTESVPKVDKIFGPGNQYVTVAKQLVSRDTVAIDMPAGPSEVAVFVDKHANPAFAASDLLSQAEHGYDSQVVLVSSSRKMAAAVIEQVDLQLETLPRKEIATVALENSIAIVTQNKADAVDLLNQYAAEHLILQVSNADEIADKIINAGSIFIGPYSPESVGDYASGTNHTLPTSGWARSTAGVSLDSFVKKITYQKLSAEGLQAIGGIVETMATHEQLDAHRNAVTIRLDAIRSGDV
ncbi:MAG: histidinol dehydrogenase [Cyclobacteriaceae bacterium]